MTWTALRVILLVALAVFYVSAASEHARQVNTSKARGDQSGYLWNAQNLYGNWHGSNPPVLIGERNRMPVYAAFLAAFCNPSLSNDDFFDKAKRRPDRLGRVSGCAVAVHPHELCGPSGPPRLAGLKSL